SIPFEARAIASGACRCASDTIGSAPSAPGRKFSAELLRWAAPHQLFINVFRFYAMADACLACLTALYTMYIRCFVDWHVELNGLQFVWDEAKADANIAKHGVRFEEACEVFFDPLLRFDDASVPEEARQAVIGMTSNRTLLFVVHLEIESDAIRIISARAATSWERSDYEDYA
ncbi:MAG TPA: BrnT family toxin, partial [Acidobacteriaceae bacterium]